MSQPAEMPANRVCSFRVAEATTRDLEECFGVTKAYLGKLASEGRIQKAGRDRWMAFETVAGFVRMLRTRKVNQYDGGGDSEMALDLDRERARKTKAEADIAEIQASLLTSRIHEAKAVEELWIGQLMSCRMRLLGLPSKIAAQVPSEIAAHVLETATDLVHEALRELSEYDPQKIAERTDKRRLFEAAQPEDDESLATASKVVPEPVG
jgi:phage terminase Nu1 subunit (DNA packaging protein)